MEIKLPALATEANSTKRKAKRCEPVCFQLVSLRLPVSLWWICKKGGRSDDSMSLWNKEGEGLSVKGGGTEMQNIGWKGGSGWTPKKKL